MEHFILSLFLSVVYAPSIYLHYVLDQFNLSRYPRSLTFQFAHESHWKICDSPDNQIDISPT